MFMRMVFFLCAFLASRAPLLSMHQANNPFDSIHQGKSKVLTAAREHPQHQQGHPPTPGGN